MKIGQVGKIVIVDIDTISKFNLIEERLITGVIKCIENTPHFPQKPEEYMHFLKTEIQNQNPRFKLIAGINTKDQSVAYFCAMFIVMDDGYPACFINSMYAEDQLAGKVADSVLWYVEGWAKKFQCVKMLYHTSQNKKAFYRLGKRFGWKPKPVIIFERGIN